MSETSTDKIVYKLKLDRMNFIKSNIISELSEYCPMCGTRLNSKSIESVISDSSTLSDHLVCSICGYEGHRDAVITRWLRDGVVNPLYSILKDELYS